MKNRNIIFLLVLIGLVQSCNDNPISPQDDILLNNLIGHWKSTNNYSIEFFNDGSFLDTIQYIKGYDNSDTMVTIRSGEYSVTNSILLLNRFVIDTVKSNKEIPMGVGIGSTKHMISIEQNVIKRKRIELFKNVDIAKTNNQLWGKWITNGWYSYYHSDPSEIIIHSTSVTNAYEFVKDSTKYKVTSEYDNANFVTDSVFIDFTFLTPNINVPSLSVDGIDVFVSNRIMIWTYPWEIEDLIKIK